MGRGFWGLDLIGFLKTREFRGVCTGNGALILIGFNMIGLGVRGPIFGQLRAEVYGWESAGSEGSVAGPGAYSRRNVSVVCEDRLSRWMAFASFCLWASHVASEHGFRNSKTLIEHSFARRLVFSIELPVNVHEDTEVINRKLY